MAHITHIAAAHALDASGRMMLFPAGPITTSDGRGTFSLSEADALHMVHAYARRTRDVCVDYDHQTYLQKGKGGPAPAAGWITSLEWVKGEGLYAHVEWTAAARAAIEAREIRYSSPSFQTLKNSNRILPVLLIPAVTNDPAIANIGELIAATASNEEATMDMNKLRALLGLPDTATEAEIEQAIAQLIGAKKEMASAVPVTVVQQLQGQIAQLQSALQQNEVKQLVDEGTKAGKLPEAMRTWAMSQTPDTLRTFLAAAPALPFAGMQTASAQLPPGGGSISDEDAFVAKKLGLSADQMGAK